MLYLVEGYMREEPLMLDGYDRLLDPDMATYALTDGDIFVRASGNSSERVLVSCHISDDKPRISELLDESRKITGRCGSKSVYSNH